MATDKKHIAVYLDSAVEQALIAFCEQKGLISKKGFMYSAGVNAALAEFFSIADTEIDNIPLNSGNILDNASNTLNNFRNIPTTFISNIPASNTPADNNILLELVTYYLGVITYLLDQLVTYPSNLVTYHLKAL
jgi:hypothetical protein